MTPDELQEIERENRDYEMTQVWSDTKTPRAISLVKKVPKLLSHISEQDEEIGRLRKIERAARGVIDNSILVTRQGVSEW